MRWEKCCIFNIPKISSIGCPNGFIDKVGDVSGNGLTGKYTASLEKCTKDCNGRDDCNSFEHSIKLNQCKLLAEKIPTGKKCGDFHFCAKKIDNCTGNMNMNILR